MSEASARGVLYPQRLPTFRRVPAAGDVAALVRWFWVSEWSIAPGLTSRQQVIGFPACNLVVENTVTGISGPTTRTSHRDLTGSGWVLGALLRPAAVPAVVGDPEPLRDQYTTVDHPDLAVAVRQAMNAHLPGPDRHVKAISVFAAWITHRVGAPTQEALLANHMVHAAERNRELLSVSDLAAHLHLSIRSVQRLAAKYVGLPPAALIRRRRLQEAAERVRLEPSIDLTALAQELGYADHAHLTNDFRTTLGFTPTKYRRQLLEDDAG